MKREDKILVSGGITSHKNKVQIFAGGNHVTPIEELLLQTSFDFGNSFRFSKPLDARASEGDYDFYLTPAQYKKWRKQIESKIVGK